MDCLGEIAEETKIIIVCNLPNVNEAEVEEKDVKDAAGEKNRQFFWKT